MKPLQATGFEQFFLELHEGKRDPFPWQIRLARRVCEENWPKVIDLPTASGKTACIEIALFALAVRRHEAPRRIFFVVDRRVIVSQAFEHAQYVARRLKEARRLKRSDILGRVAGALGELAHNDETPLAVRELRGGAFRDESWVRTPLQPTVIASTVDQIGSRILFRGYGVSENSWPIHAGLIANDSLVFLDEAHCSGPFAQTLDAIEHYRKRATDPLGKRFHFVEMTATPTRAADDKERFTIEKADESYPELHKRLFASKPVHLPEPIKCRKDEFEKWAAALTDEAVQLADKCDARRIAIMVNRIDTARQVHASLIQANQNAIIVIGRMRPLDRDELARKPAWKQLKAGEPRPPDAERQFVVSTQCLEVGADLDFDVLVTECASMDALQQRFGRLDRLGDFGRAQGAILASSWQVSGKEADPVYGDALRNTWNFLKDSPKAVNMGIKSSPGGDETVSERLKEVSEDARAQLVLARAEVPMLLPSHIDTFVETSSELYVEPSVELFLHGVERGAPDVYVVWRSDLDHAPETEWSKIVALCPPSSSEAMPVPLWAFRKWLKREPFPDESDLEIASEEEPKLDKGMPRNRMVLWDGREKSRLVYWPSQVLPGATVVLPSSVEGWDELGHKPEKSRIDRGDEARLNLRRQICLRLHPALLDSWEPFENREELKKLISRDDADPNEIWRLLKQSGASEFLDEYKNIGPGGLSKYPAGPGWVVQGYFGQEATDNLREVFLDDHLRHVVHAVDSIAGDLLPESLTTAVKTAARYHDYGKVEPRFQAWLRNGDEMAARFAGRPLAKSKKLTVRTQQDCGLPKGFRHELLSVAFASKALDLDPETRDLILHLIGSHHGRCRPFTLMAPDESPECVEFAGIRICRQELVDEPPSALSNGVAERFWKLTRRYGWWGLAYLECVLRLADWQASDDEKSGVLDD